MGRLLGREQRALTSYENAFLMASDVSPSYAFQHAFRGEGVSANLEDLVALHLALALLRRLGQLAAGHTVKESQFHVLLKDLFLLVHGNRQLA